MPTKGAVVWALSRPLAFVRGIRVMISIVETDEATEVGNAPAAVSWRIGSDGNLDWAPNKNVLK